MLTMLMFILGAFCIAVVIAACLSAWIIWQNDLPLQDPPGAVARLQTYLSSHVASTADDSDYPELKPIILPTSMPQLSAIIKRVVTDQGWELVAEGQEGRELHVVITTPMMKFKDDFLIRLSSTEGQHTRVDIHSESRSGKADFGTNTRHLLNFRQALQDALK